MRLEFVVRGLAWAPFGIAFLRMFEIFVFKYNLVSSAVVLAAIALGCLSIWLFPALMSGSVPLDQRTSSLALSLFAVSGSAVALQFALLVDRVDLMDISAHLFLRSRWLEMFAWLALGLVASRGRFKRSGVVGSLLVFPLALVVLQFGRGDSGFIDYDVLAEGTNYIYGLSHLAAADYALLVGYVGYVVAPTKLRLILILCLAYTLLELGGRATFYLGIGVLAVHHLAYLRRVGDLVQAGLVLAIFASGLIAYYKLSSSTTDEFLVRMLFSDGVQYDLSASERLDSFTRGVGLLSQQLWFGNAALLVDNFGAVGSYMHNALSAWQFFGAPFFLLFLYAWREVALRTWKLSAVAKNDGGVELAALLISYSVLSLLISKPATFWVAWFTLGFGLGLRRVNRPPKGALGAVRTAACLPGQAC